MLQPLNSRFGAITLAAGVATLLGCGGGGSIEAEPQAVAPITAEAGAAPARPLAATSSSDAPAAAQATVSSNAGAAALPEPLQPSTAAAPTSAAAPATVNVDLAPPPQVSVVTQAAAAPAADPPTSARAELAALAQTPGLLMPPRTAVDDWASARRLAASDAGWKDWVAGMRNLVSIWFATLRDRADLVAGYPNDYADPVSGAALSWTIDTPMPASQATPAAVKVQQAWIAINRQYNISRTLDAARLYRLGGDAALAELAARQLDFYAANYLQWPQRTAIGNARMLAQSLDEAVSVLSLLEAADALDGYASGARKAAWRDGLFRPIAANLPTYGYGPLNNINLWCAVALAAIGMHLNDQALLDAGLAGPKGISAVLAEGVSRDGIWAEGSFAYNNYVLLALARFFDLAALNKRGDLVAQYVPDTQRMLLAPLLFRFDDGTLPTPSDTRNKVAPVDTSTHLALYRHVPSSFGIQQAAATRSWATLLDTPPALAAKPALPPTRTVDANDVRMLLLRQGSWQLFVHYGQKMPNHAQEEAMTYELVDGTTSITRDAGTATSYSAPQHLYYFSKGVGNNVPLVDGQGQQQWAPGAVTQFDAAAGTFAVTHAGYRSGVDASRSYRLSSSGYSETTRIVVQGTRPAPRRLGVIFNTACTLTVSDPRAGAARTAAAPFADAGYGFWSGTQSHKPTATTWVAQLGCGGKRYELAITGPAGQIAYRAVVPDTPLPATRNALYVEATGTDVSFTTAIRALP